VVAFLPRAGRTTGFDRIEPCQFMQSLRRWPAPLAAMRRAVVWGRRAWWSRHVASGQGAPSQFRLGETVRVKDAAVIAQLLDGRNSTRGLLFTDSQWAFCGRTMTVDRVVCRMADDHGVVRPISRAVTLAGASCGAGGHGCGRSCALLFKDEWLDPAPAARVGENRDPSDVWDTADVGIAVRVRTPGQVAATLGAEGRVEGVAPPLDLDLYQGRLFRSAHPVAMPSRLAGLVPAPPTGEWYVIDGTRCSGLELAGPEPCDRRCALVWHRSWLDQEPVDPYPS
jgi:hypothetical protein